MTDKVRLALIRCITEGADRVKSQYGILNRKKKKHNPFPWVVEPVMEEPSYLQKPMFERQACYGEL